MRPRGRRDRPRSGPQLVAEVAPEEVIEVGFAHGPPPPTHSIPNRFIFLYNPSRVIPSSRAVEVR
jgi:hypothetical protein